MRYLNDSDGDSLRIEMAQPPYEGLVLSAIQRGDEGIAHHAIVGPIDPHWLISQIHAEMEWDRPITWSKDEKIDSGTLEVDAAPENASEGTLDVEVDAREDMPHTRPATAENPRVWAGADEPVIDSLIGRVADLEDEKERTEAHERLAEHWDRRLEVVQRALTMLPAPGKRGGLAAAFAGEEVEQSDRVEKALKIARFAADEDRDIPGVDR